MTELHHLLPFGWGNGGAAYNGYWWLMLAVVVFAIVLPVAYLAGRGGRPPLQH